MKTNIFITTLMIMLSLNLAAQKSESNLYRPVQIAFFFPLSSNGINSLKYNSNFSLNILFGLNGGIKGAEIGSIFNFNKNNVTGVQIAGVTNINSGASKGVILSGITNICRDSTEGVMISGILNNSKGSASGVQVSTINVSENEFNGIQIGVVNTTKKLKGIQVGVINYVEEDNGALPIGLISIIKNGHYEFEIVTGDALYANINFKMGVEKFYTIFKTGYTTFKGESVYTAGLGFGTNFSIKEKHKLCLDFTFNNLFFRNNFKNQNSLNENSVIYKYKICKHLGIFAGPSFKIYKSEVKIDNEFGTLNTPYSIYTNKNATWKLTSWIGLNAGISVNL